MVELVQLSATLRHYLTHLLRRLCGDQLRKLVDPTNLRTTDREKVPERVGHCPYLITIIPYSTAVGALSPSMNPASRQTRQQDLIVTVSMDRDLMAPDQAQAALGTLSKSRAGDRDRRQLRPSGAFSLARGSPRHSHPPVW